MRRESLLLAIVLALLIAAPAVGQTGSVDFQGPTVGVPLLDGFFGVPIGAADILTTAPPGPPGPNPLLPGPLPSPGIEVGGAAGAVGVVPGGLGILPGFFCGTAAELDALSYGRDAGTTLAFSVDEFASGVAGAPPDVFSEGIGGATEASADAFAFLGAVAPTAPGPVIGNAALSDGDGLAPSGLPGSGQIEPNPPTAGALPDPGDNLDAFDADTAVADLSGPIFFSLDSSIIDLLDPPANCATAVANGFSGADVLVSVAGGAPAVAIPATALGLDLLGFDTDDLDALAFHDADGSLSLTAGDTIYFSVRRGSAVIGTLDSLFGFPIEEGDVLIPVGSGVPPAIFIGAEALGLATLRGGTAGPFGSDDLDALDVFTPPPPTVVPALGAWGQGVLVMLLLGVPLLTARRRRARR
jgi:hypothetical protein